MHQESNAVQEEEKLTVCEQCGSDWSDTHMCYCETCNKGICLSCAEKTHINNPVLKQPHDVFYISNLEPVGKNDGDLCGNEHCRHYRKDHKDGNCIICQTRITKSIPPEVIKNITCTAFVDQSAWSDAEKFWKSFDKACTFNIPKELKKGEMPALYTKVFALEMLCEKDWKWRPAKTQQMINAMIEAQKIKVVPTRLYDSNASKFENCLVRLSEYA